MSGLPRILFSAGINISAGVRTHPRIDEDADALRPLLREQATLLIFNHQGDYAKGTAQATPWLAPLLSEQLQRPVHYCSHSIGAEAREFIAQLPPDAIGLMGNTRAYAQEQQNDADFARELARSGDRLVIGGFSKLHRKNASNCAIKQFIPWRYSQGVLAQLDALESLRTAHYQHKSTILLLGGNKKEKVQFLFNHARLPHVDRVIAGGAVLNSLLKARGFAVGRSDCLPLPAGILSPLPVYQPDTVIVATVSGRLEPRPVRQVRDSDRIVDFIFDERFLDDINSPDACSFFAAGPLSLPQSQYAHAAYRCLARKGIEGLFMGGDTLSEVETFSSRSSGGGAVLHFFSAGYGDILQPETYAT
ncbi:phosphoglycerate kinase [Erwinia sp. 9145]|uniref:phosphoglycerate kinase n=1 Tax=Erwinia sp. 9145 TaxID=1500895 RepID=UPI000551456F|nr:phosphoglycerate kinase [Erwinia sp. 9145]